MSTSFAIPGQTIHANTELNSASFAIPNSISFAQIQLTDPNNAWGTVVSTTKFVEVWGIQINRNDGAGWLWWLFMGDPTASAFSADGGYSGPTGQTTWIPFGSRARDGSMHEISVSSSDIVADAGHKVRLAILTNSQIILGSEITIN